MTLECTVAGTPELRIRWYKDGKQLLPSRYYTMSFETNVASFRIEHVSKEDSGTYSFKVENDFGSSTCEAILTVLGLYCHLANLPGQQGGNGKIIISVEDRQEGNCVVLPFFFVGQINQFLLHLSRNSPKRIAFWDLLSKWSAKSLGHSPLLQNGLKMEKRYLTVQNTEVCAMRTLYHLRLLI